MKFTVREVGVASVTVDFEDGSWAEVPLSEADKNREELIRTIMQFAPRPAISFVGNVPLAVGEEVEARHELDPIEVDEVDEEEKDLEQVLTWDQMRYELYPKVRDQLDALYWARQGKPDLANEIDAAIKEIKRAIPKGLAPMSRRALSLYLLDQ